jgi:hypothetical protein
MKSSFLFRSKKAHFFAVLNGRNNIGIFHAAKPCPNSAQSLFRPFLMLFF